MVSGGFDEQSRSCLRTQSVRHSSSMARILSFGKDARQVYRPTPLFDLIGATTKKVAHQPRHYNLQSMPTASR